MAERRMFAKSVVTSDTFLDMEFSARCLYFTLGMYADDDGFINNQKSITRQIGAKKEDLDELFNNKFLILFDSGVIVIRHWKMNNQVRTDRHKSTIYQEEFRCFEVDDEGCYRLITELTTTNGVQDDNQTTTNGVHSIGKISLDKDSIELGQDSLGNKKKERKKIIDNTPTQEKISDFSLMTDEELLDWGSNRKMEIENHEFMKSFLAWCDECKKRRIEASKWKGKIIKNGDTFERLKSHEEVMDCWQVPKVLRIALKDFLRSCYANGHLVTNEKLVDIIFHLETDYDTENDRVMALGRAISGGYFDIKRYS